MHRFAQRAWLAISVVTVGLVGWWFHTAGGPTDCDPGQVASDELARADRLAAAGQHTAATAVRAAAASSPSLTEAEAECVGDRLEDGAADDLRDRLALGGSRITRDSALGPLGLAPVARVTVILAPLTLGFLLLRELRITHLDRRPGPVEIEPVKVIGTDEKLSPRVTDLLRRSLADLDLYPNATTPGGLGELVVEVNEVISGASGAVAQVLKGVQRAISPESGVAVAAVLSEDGDKQRMTLDLRTRRGGHHIAIRELTAATVEDLTGLAAAEIQRTVMTLAPLDKRSAAWSRWQSSGNLHEYRQAVTETSPTKAAGILEDLAQKEPTNLYVHLRSSLNHRWAAFDHRESSRDDPPVADARIDRHGFAHLQQAALHAATAVRLAPHLMEARLALISGLVDARWDQARREVADPSRLPSVAAIVAAVLERERLRPYPVREAMRTLRATSPESAQIDHRAASDIETEQALMLAGWLAGRAHRRMLLAPTWWRYRRPELRPTMPVAVLLPLNPRRLETRALTHSIGLTARLERWVRAERRGLALHASITVMVVSLLTLRARCVLHPRSGVSLVRYNLATLYRHLIRLLPTDGAEPKRWSWSWMVRPERQIVRQLEAAHLRGRRQMTARDLVDLGVDPDFSALASIDKASRGSAVRAVATLRSTWNLPAVDGAQRHQDTEMDVLISDITKVAEARADAWAIQRSAHVAPAGAPITASNRAALELATARQVWAEVGNDDKAIDGLIKLRSRWKLDEMPAAATSLADAVTGIHSAAAAEEDLESLLRAVEAAVAAPLEVVARVIEAQSRAWHGLAHQARVAKPKPGPHPATRIRPPTSPATEPTTPP